VRLTPIPDRPEILGGKDHVDKRGDDSKPSTAERKTRATHLAKARDFAEGCYLELGGKALRG